jgi:hypothetical protein
MAVALALVVFSGFGPTYYMRLLSGGPQATFSGGRGGGPPGADPLAFLAIPLFDMVVFATLIGGALVWRRDKETHKRLMLLAYISIIVAAVARLPGVVALGPMAFFGLGYSFVVLGAVYDLASRRHVHKAYIWGGALMLASVPLRLTISGTGMWRAFAQMLTR